MSEATNEKEKTSGSGGIVMALLLIGLLLPVLYVLSVGPAAMFYQLNNDGPEWLSALYAPLMWLSEVLPALQPVLQWYVELWIDVDS